MFLHSLQLPKKVDWQEIRPAWLLKVCSVCSASAVFGWLVVEKQTKNTGISIFVAVLFSLASSRPLVITRSNSIPKRSILSAFHVFSALWWSWAGFLQWGRRWFALYSSARLWYVWPPQQTSRYKNSFHRLQCVLFSFHTVHSASFCLVSAGILDMAPPPPSRQLTSRSIQSCLSLLIALFDIFPINCTAVGMATWSLLLRLLKLY